MKKMVAGAALALFALAGTASAADVSAPVYDWSGFYAGAFAQYFNGDANAQASGGGGKSNFDVNGFEGGVLAGYNWQMDRIVLGLEGDIGVGDIDGVGYGGNMDDFDIDPVSHVRGRLGFAMDNIMPFVAAGLAVADGDARVKPFGAPSELHLGWTAGGGIDVGLTDHLVVRAEYLYQDFGSKTYHYAPGTINIDTQGSLFRFAGIWKF